MKDMPVSSYKHDKFQILNCTKSKILNIRVGRQARSAVGWSRQQCCLTALRTQPRPSKHMSTTAEPTKSTRVKVGVSRLQQPAVSSSAKTTDPSANTKDLNFQASDTALVNYCNSAFLRSKRKLNPENLKVLTIDSDVKLKKSATVVERAAQPEAPETVTAGPRVEIINGVIVLKESSLMVANPDSQIVEGEYEEIEEGIHASSRYSSFLNKKKPKSWTIEETRQFYKALQQCGTEFSVMETFLPHRSRKELKMKFFREENQHPELVKRALESSVPLELELFEEKTSEANEAEAESTAPSSPKE